MKIIQSFVAIVVCAMPMLTHADYSQSIENKAQNLGSSVKEASSDSLITTSVKSKFAKEKLLGDADVNAMSVGVETNNGIVHLTGTVKNQEQLNNAAKFAKAVDGVKEVKNDIKIKAATNE